MYNEENKEDVNSVRMFFNDVNEENMHESWNIFSQEQSEGVNKETDEMFASTSISDWLTCFLIMGIPVYGIIMMYKWGFGKEAEKSKANFFKAALIWNVIWIVVTVMFLVIMFTAI